MREIEIKIKTNNLDSIKSKLQELGCKFSEPLNQHDEVFIADQFKVDRSCLRIRKQNNKAILTYKRSIKEGNELDSIEKETDISDPESMREILVATGYKTYSIVEKVRTKTNYKEFEICLDEVKELGDFIEVEKVVEEDGDAENVEAEIVEFITNVLGEDINQRVYKGYDNLILELKK